jgi:SPP1 family predicted phage head-tail adaptor
MQGGKLRDYVTIQTYTDAFNSYGETIKNWTTYQEMYASIMSVSGREYLQSDKVQGDAMYKIRIRYLDGVSDKMRVLHDTTVYEIEAVLPDRTSDRYQILMCRRLDGQ